MTRTITHQLDPKLDLVLERVVDVPPQLVWRAWTEPALMKQWFTPKPWSTVHCEVDLRPGGKFRFVMRSPEGKDHDNIGCLLEVVENRRLVWTDALGPGYRPRESGFMTAFVNIEPSGSGTKYVARASHKDEKDRKTHEDMGFHGGWSTALDQLVALVKTL
jgi:uncharacterized protein YndB with AHSA1/START domain